MRSHEGTQRVHRHTCACASSCDSSGRSVDCSKSSASSPLLLRTIGSHPLQQHSITPTAQTLNHSQQTLTQPLYKHSITANKHSITATAATPNHSHWTPRVCIPIYEHSSGHQASLRITLPATQRDVHSRIPVVVVEQTRIAAKF